MDTRFIDKNECKQKNRLWYIIGIIGFFITLFFIIAVNRRNLAAQDQILASSIKLESNLIASDDSIVDLTTFSNAGADLAYSLETMQIDGSKAEFSGWLLNRDDVAANGNIYLFINDIYFPCQINPRKDVADKYGNSVYENSGFSCQIDVSGWPVADYSVVLCSVNESEKLMYQILILEKLQIN